MSDSVKQGPALALDYDAQTLWETFSRCDDCAYDSLMDEWIWGAYALEIPVLAQKMSTLNNAYGDSLDISVKLKGHAQADESLPITFQQMADTLEHFTGTVINFSHVCNDGNIVSYVYPDGASFVVNVMSLVPTVVTESLSMSKGVLRIADDCCRTLESLRMVYGLKDGLDDYFDELLQDDDALYDDIMTNLSPVKSMAALLRNQEIDIAEQCEIWAQQILESGDVKMMAMVLQNNMASVKTADTIIHSTKSVLELGHLLEQRQGAIRLAEENRRIQEEADKARAASLKVITNTNIPNAKESERRPVESKLSLSKNPLKLV